MTREERLVFCKQCEHQKMDLQQGIICSLTSAPAAFEGNCDDFVESPEKAALHESHASPEVVGPDTVILSPEELEKYRSEQNLGLGIAAAIGTGLVGAILWATLTVATGYQIGYMALAIGFGVGFMNRQAGKGIDPIFGISGAIIALVSVFLGNIFSIIAIASDELQSTFFETLSIIDFGLLFQVMMDDFSPIDILFYGIAAYEGYKFSFRTFEKA